MKVTGKGSRTFFTVVLAPFFLPLMCFIPSHSDPPVSSAPEASGWYAVYSEVKGFGLSLGQERLPQRAEQCRWRWTRWCRRPRRTSRLRRTTAASCSSGCTASTRLANRYQHLPRRDLSRLQVSICDVFLILEPPTPPHPKISKQCYHFLLLQANGKMEEVKQQ